MVEIRFKPADVGTVADGAITDIKINASADITMSKLNLAITDSEIDAIGQAKVTNLVADLGNKVGTGPLTGDKKITAIGWDDVTGEVVIDHEA